MLDRTVFRAVQALILSTGLASLLACGGSRPAPAEPAAEAPAAAPAEPAAEQNDAPVPAPAVEPPQAPKPQPKPAPAPKSGAVAEASKPAPPPKPAPIEKTLAVGTELNIEMVDGASSKTAKVGDVVQARVTQDVIVDGLTVVPAGAIVAGTVTEAVPLKKIGGQSSLGLKFDVLEIPGGTTTPIVANLLNKSKSETGKDAGTIAGATAGGALLGRLFSKHDKTKGTVIGAVVGAAAGTGIAASTKGQEVELPAGTALVLNLEAPAQITVQP